MAEDTVDAAIKVHNLKAGPSRTVGLFLQGGKDWSPTLYIRLVQDYGLESEVCGHRHTTLLSCCQDHIQWPGCDHSDLEGPFAVLITLGSAKENKPKKQTKNPQ